jgi:cbb3-type cytochrome oxidase subunit 3
MLKHLLTFHSAEIGLLMFFICFVLITVWTITRTRNEVDNWSSLPLGQTNDPHERETE